LPGLLSNIHCHSLRGGKRLALVEGENDWLAYLRAAPEDGIDRWVLIEFVEGDSPDSLERDAVTLRGWEERRRIK
jgi:sugar phosphate isomerase/epimerase